MTTPTGGPALTGRAARLAHRPARWPLLIIGAPAAVAVWTGWVGLGTLCGFGVVDVLPGIADVQLDSRITLPLGAEAYAVYALHHATSPATPRPARRFAAWSSAGAFLLGLAAQVTYHLLTAAHVEQAPWPVTVLVSSVLVLAIGSAAMLWHLLGQADDHPSLIRRAVDEVGEASGVVASGPHMTSPALDASTPGRGVDEQPLAASPAGRPSTCAQAASTPTTDQSATSAASSSPPLDGPSTPRPSTRTPPRPLRTIPLRRLALTRALAQAADTAADASARTPTGLDVTPQAQLQRLATTLDAAGQRADVHHANGHRPSGSLAVLERPPTPPMDGDPDASIQGDGPNQADAWTRYDQAAASGHPWTWARLGEELGVSAETARGRARRRASTRTPRRPPASTPTREDSTREDPTR